MRVKTFPVFTIAVAGVALLAAQRELVSQRAPDAQPAVVNVSNDPRRGYGESQIVINPKNANNLVIGTNRTHLTRACLDSGAPECKVVKTRFGEQPMGRFGALRPPDAHLMGVFVSFDRGKSWKRVDGPTRPPVGAPHLTDKGDPSLTVTADGTIYYSFDALDWGSPEKAIPSAGVGVSKSTDGGLTWSQPVLSGTPADGPKITADLSTGRVYVAGSNRLGTLSSGDPNATEGSFSDRWVAAASDGVKWSRVQRWGGGGDPGFSARGAFSAAHGALAVGFHATEAEACKFFVSGPAPCTVFQTTTDDGATWTRHRVPGSDKVTGNASMAADPKVRGHFTLAVNVGGQFQAYQTRDSGKTWTGPTTIASDAKKTHFHPWMAYSMDGVLGMIWRSNEPGPAPPYASSVWAVISRDGGATFSQPLKISDSPAPLSGRGNSGDDYSGIAVGSDELYVSWADWRTGERAIAFSAVNLRVFQFPK